MRIESDMAKTASVVLLLCGVYGGVVFWPGEKQHKALAAEIQTRQAQLDQMHVPDLTPLRSEIAQLRAELRDSAVSLPNGASPYRVLDMVSEAITRNGVTVYDTSQLRPETYARFSVMPVDVKFNCGFDRAFEVLRAIEQSDQPVRIERLELTGSPDETTGHVGVTMRMSSFFLTQIEQGGRR